MHWTRAVPVLVLLGGCYLFHGLDGRDPPEGARRDAGTPDGSVFVDSDVPPDPECPEPRRFRLECTRAERVAVRPLTYPDDTALFLDSVAGTSGLSVLVVEGSAYCSVMTLDAPAGRLERTEPFLLAPGAAPFVRGGALVSTSSGMSAVLLESGERDDTTPAIRTLTPLVLEWPSEMEAPRERRLPAVSSRCALCVTPLFATAAGGVLLVRPDERLFDIARLDLDAMAVETVEHDAPARSGWAGPVLAAAAFDDGTVAVTGAAGPGEPVPAFGAVVLPDGTSHETPVPGSLSDPAPVVAADPARRRFVWARHLTRPEDTFDASVYVWTVEPSGEVGPRVRVPTPGGGAPLAMSAAAGDEGGPVVAWTDRVPGSLTDSRVWLLPPLPETDRCAEVAASPIATVREGAIHPDVRAVTYDGAFYVFYVEDRSPRYSGDAQIAVDRVECAVEPLDP